MEAHLSVYFALKYGRISIAVKRNTRKKSSRICFARESFKNGFNPVCLQSMVSARAVTMN